MKVICAWCNPKYKPRKGEQITHSICDKHQRQQLNQIKKAQRERR